MDADHPANGVLFARRSTAGEAATIGQSDFGEAGAAAIHVPSGVADILIGVPQAARTDIFDINAANFISRRALRLINPIKARLTCPYMALNTMEKLYIALRDLNPWIEIEDGLRLKAKKSLDRTLAMASETVEMGDLRPVRVTGD